VTLAARCSRRRARKAKPNHADRLRKYLARYDLDWSVVQDALSD
jgi:sigma54-dependent transcription regulator